MCINREKAAIFVQRLWDNPSINGLSPLQKEEQLHRFITANAKTLQPTLTSSAFFPDLPWFQIEDILKHSISQITNKNLEPLYDRIVTKHLNLSFISTLNKKREDLSELNNQIGQYLRTLADKPGSRNELIGPLLGITTGMVDKYIQHAMQRQAYIYIELTKIQRLNISQTQIADFIKVTMLLRPSVAYFSPKESKTQHITPTNAQIVLQNVMKVLSIVPKALIQSGINSFLSFQEFPQMESSSRLATIFSNRCRSLKTGMKAERGAETSDRSWFSVAHKNYKYYGFDLNMLFELQNIASENGW